MHQSAGYTDGSIQKTEKLATQVYQQMGITVDTDAAMKALKNAGREEVPSAWKVDLVIYPDLFWRTIRLTNCIHMPST